MDDGTIRPNDLRTGGGHGGRRRAVGLRRRASAGLVAAVAVVGSILTGILPAALQPAGPFPGAVESTFVSFTLEACRLTAGTTLPIGGKFICPDAMYTTGN